MKLIKILESLLYYENIIGGIQKYVSNADLSILETEITSITCKSNDVIPGAIFVAIDGTINDGHKYINDARKNGAVFCIGTYSKTELASVPDLIVKNARAILGPASSIMEENPSNKIAIAGVTGTNGKTTITYILNSIYSFTKKKNAIIGTTGIYIDGNKQLASQTTPDAIILQSLFNKLVKENIDAVAMEVSSHALDQYRVLGTNFDAVAFTNLTQDHLDYHLNFENYFNAKAELFNGVYSKNGVINIDDKGKYSQQLIEKEKKNGMNLILVSTKNPNADVYIETMSTSLTGSEIQVTYIDKDKNIHSQNIKTSLIGSYNIENIAVSIGLAIFGGLLFEDILNALCQQINIPGRLERILNVKGGFEIFIDYAHTPDALERSIFVLKPLSNKLITIFGCGGDRDVEKRSIMGKIASENSDFIIITNDNPRSEDPQKIADGILEGISNDHKDRTMVILDRYKAIEYALLKATVNDCILIAGKGHENYQEFADGKHDFSDVNSVTEILKKESK